MTSSPMPVSLPLSYRCRSGARAGVPQPRLRAAAPERRRLGSELVAEAKLAGEHAVPLQLDRLVCAAQERHLFADAGRADPMGAHMKFQAAHIRPGERGCSSDADLRRGAETVQPDAIAGNQIVLGEAVVLDPGAALEEHLPQIRHMRSKLDERIEDVAAGGGEPRT